MNHDMEGNEVGKISSIFTQYRGLSRTAYVLFFGKMITNMGAFIFPMLAMILARKFGYEADEIGLIMIGVGVLYLPMSFIGGKLADRFDKKKLIVVFDLVSVGFFISCAFVEPGIYMLVYFVIAGMFANLEGPAYEALIVESTLPEERERVFSLSYLGHNLGYAIGVTVGAMLIDEHLPMAFIFDGLTTLTSTILIVTMVKVIKVDEMKEEQVNEYEAHEEEDKDGLRVMWERKSVFIQVLTFFLLAFIYDQWTFSLPLYIDEIFDAPELYGYLGSFNAVIVIAFTPILTKVLSAMKELPKVLIGVGLYAFSFLVITNKPAYFIFFIMIFMFTLGEIVNMLGQSPFISRRVPASHRGRINSYVFISFFLGSMTGKLVVGQIITRFNFDVAFYFIGLVGAVTLGVVWMNMKLDRQLFPKLYERHSSAEAVLEEQ